MFEPPKPPTTVANAAAPAAPRHAHNCPCRDCTGYSGRELHFTVAHWPEYVAIAEGPDQATRELREYLRHEWEHLPAGIICRCDKITHQAEVIGVGGGGGGPKTPSVPLMEVKRAYQALPVNWVARTRLYLVLHELHDFVGRIDCAARGREDCRDRSHWTYHTENDVAWLEQERPGEFAARHRRRVTLETFLQERRAQDGQSEPLALDPTWVYQRMADALNGAGGYGGNGARPEPVLLSSRRRALPQAS